MSEAKQVRVGVAVIVRNWNDDILFHRRKGKHGHGTWSFPGGAMELNETPVEAATRELIEETGTDAVYTPLKVYAKCPYVFTPFENGDQWVTLYFDTVLINGRPRVTEPDKCECWDWFSADNLPEPLFAPLESAHLQLAKRWL